jgi:hypothetical protein
MTWEPAHIRNNISKVARLPFVRAADQQTILDIRLVMADVRPELPTASAED